MSTVVPVRAFNRSIKVRVGGRAVTPTSRVLVNIDNKRHQRDLARHSAIGAITSVGRAFEQADAGTVESGGVITVTGNTASGTAVVVKSAAGVVTSGAADTEALTPAVVTNGRVNLLSVTLAAPQTIVETEGTAGLPLTGVNATELVGRPAVPAGSVTLAYVVWAPAISATVVAATNVWTQTGHGYTSGQKLVVAAVTTITAPIAGAEVYVKPIDANTFTLSATPGGADIDVTAADGSALLVPPAIVVDARP